MNESGCEVILEVVESLAERKWLVIRTTYGLMSRKNEAT